MKPRNLDFAASPEAAAHEALGLPPLETAVTRAGPHPWRHDLLLLALLPLLALLAYGAGLWLWRKFLPPAPPGFRTGALAMLTRRWPEQAGSIFQSGHEPGQGDW